MDPGQVTWKRNNNSDPELFIRYSPDFPWVHYTEVGELRRMDKDWRMDNDGYFTPGVPAFLYLRKQGWELVKL